MPPKPAEQLRFTRQRLFRLSQYTPEQPISYEIPTISIEPLVAEAAALAIEQTVQLFIPGLEPDLKSKSRWVAFGRFVKPGLYDPFDEHNFDNMPEQDKNWVTPAYLNKLLFPPRGSEARTQVFRTALNPYEYRILVRARDPEHLRNGAYAKARSYDAPSEERLAAAERGGVHALERRLELMTEHAQKLRTNKDMLAHLEVRTRSPGHAHEGAIDMTALVANAWSEFGNMMDVAHEVAMWTDAERARAETSFLHYLTQGSQLTRVRHWRPMISLAKAYTTARLNLFEERITSVNENLATV